VLSVAYFDKKNNQIVSDSETQTVAAGANFPLRHAWPEQAWTALLMMKDTRIIAVTVLPVK
jgi:hypothetical protein